MVIRRLLLLSTSALLLVTLFAVIGGGSTSADLPAPAQQSYAIAENGSVDVTLAASHSDGLSGCTELTFTTASVTGGTLDPLANLACAPGATLAADIDASVTSIPVVTTTGFPDSGTLRIGDEVLIYTSTTESSFGGATRGQFGTVAAAHSTGAAVSQAEAESAPLDQPHTDGDATIIVTGTGLGFPASGVLQIEDEFITYTSWAEVDNNSTGSPDSTAFSGISRGAFGSTAASYSCTPTCATAFRAVAVSNLLSADINASATVIPLDSVASFGSPEGNVQIGDELISYAGLGTSQGECSNLGDFCLTGATRGVGSSSAAAYSSGDIVFQLSGLDTDVATSTFTPGPGAFARTVTLTAGISDTDNLMPVSTSILLPVEDIFPASGTVALDDELVSYTAIGTTTQACDPVAAPCFTGLTRGTGGTTAAAHTTGATIYQSFFTYSVGHNPTSAPSVVGVEVTPQNDPPVTSDQEFNLQTPAPVPVLITATDLDGDSGEHITGDCDLGFTVAISPANGTLSPIVNAACTSNAPNTDDVPNEDTATIAYTPDDTFFGTDTFAILICDDDTCVTATITVNISSASPTPTPTGTPAPTATPTPAPSATPVPTQLPFQFGDVDCDNDVDAVDALSILLSLAGFPPIISDDPDCPSLGDGGPTPTPTASPAPTPTPAPTDTPTPAP